MRRVVCVLVAVMATTIMMSAPAGAKPSKAEAKFLAKVHHDNIFPNATDAQLLASGKGFCRLARGTSFADAYLELDDPAYTSKQSASFFLLDVAATHTLCPDVGRKTAKNN